MISGFSLMPGIDRHPRRSQARDGAADRPAPVPDFLRPVDALRTWAAERPDDRCFYLICGSELHDLTYPQLYSDARKVATALADRGVGCDDRVAICLDTCPLQLASFFACGLIGAVPCVLPPPLGFGDLEAWSSRFTRILGLGEFGAIVASHPTAAENAGSVPVIGPADIPEHADVVEADASDASEIAFIQFSSGSTAEPKGVIVPNTALMANSRGIGEVSRWTQDDLVAGWLPLYHDMGLVGMVMSPFLHRVPVAAMSPVAFVFQPRTWLWAIHYFRATLSVAPNFAYHVCAKKVADSDLEGLDLSSWRVAYNGAEMIQGETIRAFCDRFGPYGFREQAMFPVYGLAESVLAAAFPTVETAPQFKSVSSDSMAEIEAANVGRALPGHTIRIVDAEGLEVPDGELGEVTLSGPSICRGYLGDPDETRRAFRDGWLITGDVGCILDGNLYVCGRAKDVIIVAGRNYHPYVFESCVGQLPDVRTGNVAAIGVCDRSIGTEGVVVVFETRKQAQIEPARLCVDVAEQVYRSVGLRPDRVVAVPARSLPKTTSGKIRRPRVRELLLAGQFRVLAEAV